MERRAGLVISEHLGVNGMDVCVVGLGKLGSPLAAVLASKGHKVFGVDLNPAFVERLNRGEAPVVEPGLQELITANRERIVATTDFAEAIPNTDISFVIVPTPSLPNGVFTNRYVVEAMRAIGAALRGTDRYHVVNITSTVMPGSTGGEIRDALEQASGRKVGHNLGLTYNPEFIALGTVVRDLLNPDMLLIGESDPRAGDVLERIYTQTVNGNPPIQRMNWVNAEITKISVNTYVTTKISYANMLSDLCDRLEGADVDVVSSAIGKDSRIGSKYIRGALGYGGPCFPRDNLAWSALARRLGARPEIAEATDRVNDYQIERLASLVHLTAAPRASVAILGMSYKPDTPVVEQSQGLMLAQRLADDGFQVTIHDPLALGNAMAVLGDCVEAAESAEAAIAGADVVIVTTPAEVYKRLPPELFAREQPRQIIDCWRLYDREVMSGVAELIRLGDGALAARQSEPMLQTA
jgi:UDPglucose 6-dehydrogenase